MPNAETLREVATRFRISQPLLVLLAVLLALMIEPRSTDASPLQGGGTGFGSGGGQRGKRDNTPSKVKPGAPPPTVAPSPPTAAPPAPVVEPSQVKREDADIRSVGATTWLRELIQRDIPPHTVPEVIVVQLKGVFDNDNILTLPDTITEISTKIMLQVAHERDPLAIVISIDSPGGLVDVMNPIIDTVLSLQLAEKRRIVAWPRLAGSAAALTTCACREIVVRSDCKIGAATSILASGERAPPPVNAGEQKRAAVDEARYRLMHELTNRDPLIVDGFRKPELTLYYHRGAHIRFATAVPNLPTKPPTAEPGWAALDASTSMPLVLTAEEARSTGLALPQPADSVTELIKILGLPEQTPVVEIRMDSDSIRSAVAERWVRYEQSWIYINNLTAPIIERIKKSIHKLRTALQTPNPKTREEARSMIKLLAQARATLTIMSERDTEAISAAVEAADELLPTPGRHIAQLEKLDFVLKDLRGAEDLLNHAIKHGTVQNQAVESRIRFSIQLLEEAWHSLTISGRAE